MTDVVSVFNHKLDPRTNLPSNELIDTTVLIGVEVELEGIKIPSSFKLYKNPFWDIYHDDSLRGDSVELRFNFPLKGRDLIQALHSMNDSILTLKNLPITSDRTSAHIHIDARYLNTTQLYNWIIFYIIFERLLYNYVGKKRSRSIFCVPFYMGNSNLTSINNLVETIDDEVIFNRFRESFNEDFRYSGLNLHSLLKFGSLEFRMLDGEWRKDKLILWLNILLSIRKRAVELHTSIQEYIEKLIYEDTLKEVQLIFGDLYEIVEYPEIKQHVIMGCRLANEVIKTNLNSQIAWDLFKVTKQISISGDFIEKFKTVNNISTDETKKINITEEEEEFMHEYTTSSFLITPSQL